MKANERFNRQELNFWADVRLISQLTGYTDRKTKAIKVPTIDEIVQEYERLDLSTFEIQDSGELTPYGSLLIDYFQYRSDILNKTVKNLLMNLDEAKSLFERLYQTYDHTNVPLPMNKQKGDKKQYAFFTCIINLLISNALNDKKCDYDPRNLTLITKNRRPYRTLSRRVDGCFPSSQDPVALWEIKEYYYTTTFGSRVADGVYETLVDGLELKQLLSADKRKVFHYLMIDSYQTWWIQGRSYLCRMIDLLNMGMVDEILFGKEVVDRIPELVKDWS
jgi:hypothetical protein